jgi:hypothetical protein
MKILNHTDWDTKQLQKIFKWCLKQEGLTGKLLTIEVVNQKQSRTYPNEFVSGYAYYGHGDFSRNYIRIRIPKGAIHEFSVAGTILHELAHTRGVRHKEMGRDFYHGKLDAEGAGFSHHFRFKGSNFLFYRALYCTGRGQFINQVPQRKKAGGRLASTLTGNYCCCWLQPLRSFTPLCLP